MRGTHWHTPHPQHTHTYEYTTSDTRAFFYASSHHASCRIACGHGSGAAPRPNGRSASPKAPPPSCRLSPTHRGGRPATAGGETPLHCSMAASAAATRETGRGCYLLQRLPSASRGAPLCLQPRAVRAPPAPLLVHGLLPLLPQAELPAAPVRAIISSHVGRPLRDLRGGEEG